MFKFLPLVLILISQFSYAQVDRWGDGIMGPVDGFKSFLGSENQCLSADQEEFEYVECEIEPYQVANVGAGSDFDHLTEELIFMEATRRTHQLTVCQGRLHGRYAEDAITRSIMLRNAWIQYNGIQPRLRSLLRQKSEAQGRVNSFSGSYVEDRNTPQNLNWRLERLRPAQQELADVNAEIQALVSRVPMGNRPEMQDMIIRFTANNSSPNASQFHEQFNYVMNDLRDDVTKSTEFFSRIIRPSENGGIVYSVNSDLKSALVKAGQVDNVVTSLGMEERLADRFICRTRARYVNGPRNLALVEVPFYFAGVYGLGRLALRAGVYAASTGSRVARGVAETTRRAARLGMAGVTTTEFATGVDQVLEACFPQDFLNGTPDEQCTAESEILGAYQESSIAQCLTTSALTVAPPAFVGIRGVTRMVRPTGIPSLSRALGRSGRFRYTQSGRGEVPFNEDTLQPGVSYTVVIDDQGRVVLGSNYRNAEGGFSRTHMDVLDDVTEGPLTRARRSTYEGGTIRVNADGSFDVSGYRRRNPSERSAELIENALREVLPGATIRSTPGKLLPQ